MSVRAGHAQHRRIDLGLFNGRGWPTGERISAQIGADLVTLWHGDRTLAVFHRGALAGWIQHPHNHLVQDDVVLSEDDGRISVTIDGRATYFVDIDNAKTLRAVLAPAH